jgi:hypothetical protein
LKGISDGEINMIFATLTKEFSSCITPAEFEMLHQQASLKLITLSPRIGIELKTVYSKYS